MCRERSEVYSAGAGFVRRERPDRVRAAAPGRLFRADRADELEQQRAHAVQVLFEEREHVILGDGRDTEGSCSTPVS